jgi:hypothetical protein
MYHKNAKRCPRLNILSSSALLGVQRSLAITKIWPEVDLLVGEREGRVLRMRGKLSGLLREGEKGLLTAGQVHDIAGLRHLRRYFLGGLDSAKLNLKN